MSRVVLATATGPLVSVFQKLDEDPEIEQVARFVNREVDDPTKLVTLISDLDHLLGWSRNGASLDVGKVRPDVETDHPPGVAAALSEGDGESAPKRRGRLRGDGDVVKARYSRIVEELGAHPSGMRFGEIHGLLRNASKYGSVSSGMVWSMLDTLRKRGIVRRVGEGLYVRTNLPADDAVNAYRTKRANRQESAERREKLRAALVSRGSLTTTEASAVLGMQRTSSRNYVRTALDGFVSEGVAIRIAPSTKTEAIRYEAVRPHPSVSREEPTHPFAEILDSLSDVSVVETGT